jgi:hypothetical protein
LDKFLFVKNIDDANQTNVNSRHSSSTILDQSDNVIPTDGVEINKVINSSESELNNLTAEEIIYETISTPESCNILESSFSFPAF